MGNVKIIGASAGSGKTYRLAYEYVKSVVENPALYRHILAVTFTNKATEEMKSRILREIHLLASGMESHYMGRLQKELGYTEEKIRSRALRTRTYILHDYSRFAVLTIDRFFQRLIRSFIKELGIDVNFNLELETDSILSEAADALIEGITTDDEIRRQLFLVARDRIEDNQRWNIKEPLLGLGKELFGEEYQRVREAAPQGKEAAKLLDEVVSRADKVRKEIISKGREAMRVIGENNLCAEDFKGKSRSLVPYLAKVASGDIGPLSKSAREAVQSADNWGHKDSENISLVESLVPVLHPLLAQIDRLFEENFRMLNSARLLKENYRNFLLLADLQKRVEQLCAQDNIMPISETNRMISRLVSGNDAPFIFEKAGSYYSRFMIDEFQDTSSLQWNNFVPLLKNAISGEEGNPVLLIGDIKQAIYRWRGGDWRILSHRVREEMGTERVEEEVLDTNFRSLRRVVEFNNALIGLVCETDNATLNALIAEGVSKGAIDETGAGELSDLLVEAYRGHTQKPKSENEEGYVTLTVYDADEQGEYIPPVTAKIEELQTRGYSPGDIAVLVRSNRQATKIAQMLLKHKHDNPSSPYSYDVVTQEALTVGSAPVSRFIVACLTLATDHDDSISRAVYNRWSDRPYGAPLTADEEEFFSRLAALSPEEAFEQIVLRYGLQDRPQDIAYIQAVHEQINTFSSRSVADIPLFLKWWGEKGCSASVTMQGGGEAITVSTIHKSKGLQYKAVIIPYMSWSLAPGPGIVWVRASSGELSDMGSIPVNYKEQMSESYFAPRYYREQVMAHIDGINLFYVAVTRAEEELHLMMSSNPRVGKNTIGGVVRSVLREDGTDSVFIGDLRGTRTVADGRDVMEFGTAVLSNGNYMLPRKVLTRYRTTPPGAKVRLRLPSARYFEDGESALTPRDLGILMHKAFENATGAEDVARSIDLMLAEGTISNQEHVALKSLVSKAFSNPVVAEWFGREWDVVRNENDIVVPGDYRVRRPDRVMINGSKAVVVDYKFGTMESPAHVRQLRGYIDLLRAMGHEKAEGYIWYVTLDKIEKV